MKKKHTVGFAIGDQCADLELCVFCKRMEDVSKPGECEYYAEEYNDCECSKFDKVENVSQRLNSAIQARSTTQQTEG